MQCPPWTSASQSWPLKCIHCSSKSSTSLGSCKTSAATERYLEKFHFENLKLIGFISQRTNALGLVSQVPNLKFILEKLVQRVKGMLVVNKCANSMWVGNLKSRDLHGENIPSQIVEVQIKT
jgi:Fanconi anaemia protein FancD2 nuclease